MTDARRRKVTDKPEGVRCPHCGQSVGEDADGYLVRHKNGRTTCNGWGMSAEMARQSAARLSEQKERAANVKVDPAKYPQAEFVAEKGG